MMRTCQGKVGPFWLRTKIVPFLAILTLLLGIATVVGNMSTARASTTITVSGVAACSSGDVEGVWVASSAGGAGFASWTRLAVGGAAYYSRTVLAPTTIQLHVGCGGTQASWDLSSYSGNKALAGSQVVNTFCSAGSCAFAKTGTKTTYDMGDPGNCTWEALKLFHDYEGYWPYIVPSNASQWATKAAQAGWSVWAVPVPKSIIVFAPAQNHVAWVNSVSASSINITEMNHCGLGCVDSRTIPQDPAYRYIVAP